MRLALAAVCLALLTSGCSIALDDSIYAAPGKFDFLDCPSIAERAKKASARETELTGLMSRASEGAGGVVNALVYQDQLNTVRAELQALRKTADDKRCAPMITPQTQTRTLEPVH
jgi:hypothetical protein